MGDWAETKYLIDHFPLGMFSGPSEKMIVLQQDVQASLFEWATVYQYICRMYDPQWIAFPRVLGNRRVELIAGMQAVDLLWNPGCKHHAFGMNAGSLDELPLLNTLGIDSCDSSAPVWRGLLGYHLEETLAWPDITFDPSMDIDGMPSVDSTTKMQRKQLADRNLAKVMEACHTKLEMASPIKAATI